MTSNYVVCNGGLFGYVKTVICRIYMPYPFQWGRPTFNAGETFAMMAASLVSLFEVFSLQKLPDIFKILIQNYEHDQRS